MQAILTKYIPVTNTKPARIKAKCERGAITICPDDTGEPGHIEAAEALILKFVAEDKARYGTEKNPWSRPRVCGCLPSGSYAHVFI